MQQIRDVVARDWQGESHVGGGPFVEDAAARSSRHDVNRLSPIVIAVLVLVSAVLLGSVTAAGLNLILTGLGVGLVMGAHGRFGEPLTIVSSSLPVMMVALGGAFGVHILAGFQRQQGTSRERALRLFVLLTIPFWINEILRSFAWFIILAYQGPLNAMLVSLGLIAKPIRFLSGDTGVVIGMIYAYILFMVFPLYNAIESLEKDQIEAARDLAANDFKYWALMRSACAAGLKTFDYGRSKQGTGPYAFKKNWGFEPTPLHYEFRLYKRDAIPQNNPNNAKYKLLIDTWRRMPIGLANWLGPFIVRSLG